MRAKELPIQLDFGSRRIKQRPKKSPDKFAMRSLFLISASSPDLANSRCQVPSTRDERGGIKQCKLGSRNDSRSVLHFSPTMSFTIVD